MSPKKPPKHWPIVITRDGYVVYDPRDGYHIAWGEAAGQVRRIVDGVFVLVPELPEKFSDVSPASIEPEDHRTSEGDPST